MPFWFATAFGSNRAAAVGDRIALKLDRVTATIAYLISLHLLEMVVAFGAKQQVPGSVSNVLHVGEAATFAIGLGSFADVDAVFCN